MLKQPDTATSILQGYGTHYLKSYPQPSSSSSIFEQQFSQQINQPTYHSI